MSKYLFGYKRQHHAHVQFQMAQLLLLVLLLLSPRQSVAADDPTTVPEKASKDPVSSFVLNATTKVWKEGLFERPEVPFSATDVATARTPRESIPLLAGRVLVAGWVANRRISASAELYNASTDSWLQAGILTKSHDGRNAVFPRTKRMLFWAGVIIPF